ncbi:MAG: amidohydrolase family protein [Paracoccaceae bacterium]
MFKNFLATGLVICLSTALFAETHDIVIQNGRVIDPETGLDAVRNVAIDGKTITAISEFSLDGETLIDATGLIVSPGFVDLHAHGMALGNMRMQAMQGVTTVLELESGVLPIADWYDAQAEMALPLNYGAAAAWTFARIASFANNDPLATPDYFQNA